MWTSHTSPAPLCFISSRPLLGVSPLIEPVGCSQDNEDRPPQSRVNTAGSACCIPPRAEATDGGPDVGMTADSKCTCKWQSAHVQFYGLGSRAPQVSSLICLSRVEAKTSHRQAPPSGLKLAIFLLLFFQPWLCLMNSQNTQSPSASMCQSPCSPPSRSIVFKNRFIQKNK